ncbi:TorF family putative porin [Teredinibacter purpureus]|uniref:TorF family putative porin n=1 Tax=Teredinibacter purpureus TaxID=2731756 RepID=UPI0005F87C00|nr:TorF family putative porin [Teredinibacter purpureus]
MKTSKKLLAGAVAASLAISAMAPVANAEVSASVGVASSYLWRGIDLGAGYGNPAVSGDLSYSNEGFYAGTWVSSGDGSGGTEYDLYAGFGAEVSEVNIDLSVWSYQYPTASTRYVGVDGDMAVVVPIESESNIGDLMEAVLSIGYGPVSLSYYHGLQDLEEYYYVNAGVTFGAFSLNAGAHDDDMTHVDLSYAYNDNLSFIFSQVVDDVEGAYDDDLNVVVSYSLPIE